MSDYIAHIREDGTVQSVEEHLKGTAELAGKFAKEFGNEDWGRIVALIHDIGKYNPAFQNYIKACNDWEEDDSEVTSKKVDHSTAGGIFAVKKFGILGRIIAYCISGHHAGLPDWNHEMGVGGDLSSRLKKEELLKIVETQLAEFVRTIVMPSTPPAGKPIKDEHIHLWIRMLFSSLVDADFLDTENFMDPEKGKDRGSYPSISELKEKLDTHLSKFKPDSKVNEIRKQILDECQQKAELPSGFFTLTVPTGGGKTLSSMAFALKHAIKHNKKRIVMAIPYTSIIEQTAETYRNVFGGNSVLEHHSNLDPDKETQQSKLAAENWDAPIIVTTNVQLFESLFAAKTSSCRKLHNLANSVIILDEAQMLPTEYLKPILSSIKGLVEMFGVTVVLCSATQPALCGEIGSGDSKFKGIENATEIINSPKQLAENLKRVDLNISTRKLENYAELVNDLQTHEQVLCIVNTRKDCREIHSLMPEGTIHLSAFMCPQERSKIISEIKTRLKNKEVSRVISTQLVEAGVDIDFPVVYRALAGFDSITQAAGRCNREGKLGKAGNVNVFIPPKQAPVGMMRKGEDASKELIAMNRMDFSPDSIKTYFEIFYSKTNSFDKIQFNNRLVTNVRNFEFQFRTTAHEFNLIDDKAQKSIIVWYGESPHLIEQLRKKGIEKWLMRKLQRYSVSISPSLFKFYQQHNYIEEIHGIWVQNTAGLYKEGIGLLTEDVGWSNDFYS